MNKGERIFVAGHKGMVGSALLRALENAGCGNIVTADREVLDLRDQEGVMGFFKRERPDHVFLAAARVGGIKANSTYPAEFAYDNIMIQTNVIHSAHLCGVKKLVFMGSSCIYPKDCPQPIREEYLMSGPLEPTNEAYAIAKIAGIRMTAYYAAQFGLQGICPVPCNLYGPNDSFDPDNSHVLSALVKRFTDAVAEKKDEVVLWGTGVAVREFMHVDDMARAVLMLADGWRSSEIINVGTGETISIRELAELIADRTGYRGRIEWDPSMPDGMLKKCLDSSRLNDLGFRPEIPIHAGVEDVIREYRNRGAAGPHD
ncbi:MAG: GDP-L-fucose synthase [Syntrophorhabdus sp.]|mgnify:CR=1 FL=1|nr:GDP-L-fucose synthase [Syntrophorhabdus sp.]